MKVFVLSLTDIYSPLDWSALGISLNYVRVLVYHCSHVLIFLGVLFMGLCEEKYLKMEQGIGFLFLLRQRLK